MPGERVVQGDGVQGDGVQGDLDGLPSPFLKPAEVAEVLSVSVSQVMTLLRSGQLAGVKIGRKGVWRVSREQLEAYVAALNADAEARSRAQLG